MNLKEIKNTENPEADLAELLDIIHREGPKNSQLLESLSYFKVFHPIIFQEFEEKVISALGLFYKIKIPDNLYSFLMQGFGKEHQQDHGAVLTPVQASIRRAIDDKQYISISAPTSAGKSYSIRDFIAEGNGDAVIVVPSRALIAEYINSMIRKFHDNKGVMITSFVDLVFNDRNLRRIFVLTPERSKDLYKFKDKLNIETFFFDEAQISEEDSRGITFDISVRRVKKHFPNAKIIFAHPFIENPEAQFSKHQFAADVSYGHSYTHGAVGKLCIVKKDEACYYFSPYIEDGHKKINYIEFNGDFRNFAMNGSHSILVYVSKNSIYNGNFKIGFEDFIENLPLVTNSEALEIIDSIRHIVGADKPSHISSMVELLKKGVVIHHGSIPLEVRFLIEDFIRGKYSCLCFATSTLAQGINMPFDIVWLENNRFEGNASERALAFKNLIGRAGRLTESKIFDYGYVFTNNAKLFSERIQMTFMLSEQSVIENPPKGVHENDQKELIDAIQNNTFDDDKNIPKSKVQRLSHPDVLKNAKTFLDIFYRVPNDLRASIGGLTNRHNRDRAKSVLAKIYEASLDRELFKGEENVFNQAIDIFFHSSQGRSFSEIVGLRYSSITNRDSASSIYANFSQPAKKLPDSSLEKAYSLFPPRTPNGAVTYDSIVYDTYDYMDQVVSFSLSDTLIAAFEIYGEKTGDQRASNIIDLLRYNTNNKTHILLLRYGFTPEVIKEIAQHVETIDENKISFLPTIQNTPDFVRKIVNWYLPE
ncbi:MAG: helicase [Flavobacterium sp. 38-13]|uniref:DEAD/DEAH box helicase n=1 Tax=Flavobacterium sp. 38-13 TaxID=1896168 RepID=UPI0009615337|nr:DEAD/DEAH box helicase [Flavobacterium sp. 38-13]OJX49790.1 MAG: helicase [Flavobacterium sp. 38-13]